MEKIDCLVIGAGLLGLAVARALACSGHDVVILEAAETIGSEASSRTGEVVHSGIHYAVGSLRARLCVRGRDLLYSYCQERGIDCKMIGELVVAFDSSSITEIEKIYLQARSNGICEVELHDHASVLELEPGLRCKQALLSPSSGIVDSHGLLKALRSDAEGAGALLVLCTPVIAGTITPGGLEIEYAGPESGKLLCRSIVNCAGIHAQGIAAALKGLDPSSVPPAFLCKGSYFTTSLGTPFSRLIYSLPFEGSPGIHLSFDMAGQARFGPDSRWVESIDYDVDASGSGPFTRGVRRYWPDLPEGALRPGFAGYFARTYGPDEPAADWMIQGPSDHGIPGLINLFGIDSPGLTACMAIAELVEGMI